MGAVDETIRKARTPSIMRGGEPLIRELDAFPDPLLLHEADPERYPCLLESAMRGTPRARYDILFAFPGERLLARDGDGFLARLDGWWRTLYRPAANPAGLPFLGGWFLFLGYELAAQIEPVLRLPAAPGTALPLACAVRFPAALIRDHAAGRAYLVAEAECAGLLDQMQDDLAYRVGVRTTEIGSCAIVEDDPGSYLDAVRRIQRYIRDGDVFQVNLSRAWRGLFRADVPPAALYRRLRSRNPAPFAGLAMLGETAIISSSPERLVSVRGGGIETRPIAGTHPRAADPRDDRALSERLLGHPKERAEHIMLIDLERNDLGRICAPGSVRVSELMALESYTHVHHIVSNVCGVLRPGVGPGQAVAAVFPGGTITGCPKVRCMEIIAELEQEGRGAYTGAMGYLNRDGGMDLNILIRTMVVEGRRLEFRAGAGIVADSIAERELEETRAKARGLLRAVALP